MYFHAAVGARFYFSINETTSYTVEYSPSLRRWFIFRGREHSGAIYDKHAPINWTKDANFEAAESVLVEYFESINQ